MSIFQDIDTPTFKKDQMRYPRVRDAYAHKEKELNELLESRGLQKDRMHIYIRVFKKEKEVEVWGRHPDADALTHIITYPVCQLSGRLGPKRKQGDRQVPEGLYHIDRFNPASRFHLSLGINYPNRADRILGDAERPGGDIFIHGQCVTIGCIPITDSLIEALYILAVEAKNNGQKKIQVHIFPCRFSQDSSCAPNFFISRAEDARALWGQLKKCFDYFETHHVPPE